jgi:hypothetical protein
MAALQGYARASSHMSRRRVLPGEQGVVYHGEGKTVLSTFEPMTVKLIEEPTDVVDVLGGRTFNAREFTAAERGIYLIESEQEILLQPLLEHSVKSSVEG